MVLHTFYLIPIPVVINIVYLVTRLEPKCYYNTGLGDPKASARDPSVEKH